MRPIRLNERRARRNGRGDGSSGPALARGETVFLLESYFQRMQETLERLPAVEIALVAEELMRARSERRTVYVIGNGGSAATAGHAAVDWMKPNPRDGHGGVRTVSPVDNPAVLTAWANDTGFENVFAAQLKLQVQRGDVLIAISGSGNSRNILRAVEVARNAGAVTIGFSAFNGGALRRLVDISVVVPCDDQGMAEDVHLLLVHALAMTLRRSARAEVGDGVISGVALPDVAG